MTRSTFPTLDAEIQIAERRDLCHRTARDEPGQMVNDLFDGSHQAGQVPKQSPDEACTGYLAIDVSQCQIEAEPVVVRGAEVP